MLTADAIQKLELFAFPRPSLAVAYGNGPGLMKWDSGMHFEIVADSPSDIELAARVINDMVSQLPQAVAQRITIDRTDDVASLTSLQGKAAIVFSQDPFADMRGRLHGLMSSLSNEREDLNAVIDGAEAKQLHLLNRFAVHKSGHIVGFLTVVDSRIDDQEKEERLYVSVLVAISPSLGLFNLDPGLFEHGSHPPRLNATTVKYLSIMLDDRVPPGMTQRDFKNYLTQLSPEPGPQ